MFKSTFSRFSAIFIAELTILLHWLSLSNPATQIYLHNNLSRCLSVAGIFPPINMVLGGTIQVKNYTRPVSLGIFSRNSVGDEVRTLTICKSGINYRYIDVNIILVPVSGNFWEGHAKFCGGKASGPFSYTSNLNGKIENIRTVTYKGEDYIAVDFIIRQYGSCAVYITGMHPDITEMIDVTGEI